MLVEVYVKLVSVSSNSHSILGVGYRIEKAFSKRIIKELFKCNVIK